MYLMTRLFQLPLAIGICLWLSSSLSFAETATMSTIAPKEAATMQANNQAIILDVRELNEWQEQHIAGVIHIPLSQLQDRLPELSRYKNSPIITQCRSGKRSAQAQEALQSAGFSEVYNLNGGLNAWLKDGLDTAKR